jgi:hypothetical protein
MSNLIVNKEHIAGIVKFYLKDTNNQNFNYNDAVETANTLSVENHNSYNCRYNSDYKPDTFNFIDLDNAPKLSAVEALKAIICLKYNSCEHSTWKGSKAQKFLQLAQYTAISKLDGYDKAEWTIGKD